MAYKTFNKEIIRAITGSWGRFIAVFAIVALGVGFYSGLMMTGPNMNRAADAYYDEANLMDIRVVSSMGLTDDDIDALRQIDDVEQVVGAYEADVIADIADEPYTLRVHSMTSGTAPNTSDTSAAAPSASDASNASDAPNAPDPDAVNPATSETPINDLVLVEGAWPQNPGECVLFADRIMNNPVNIGDKLQITQSTGDISQILNTTDYTIVGLVRSPYYISTTALGSTSLGAGSIQQFMYVLPQDFSSDYPYTEAFITVSGAKQMDSSSQQYDDKVAQVMGEIEAIAPAREQARKDQLQRDAQTDLDDARNEYNAERADAEAELADAKAKLDEAQAKITSSENELSSAKSEYQSGVVSLANQRAQAESQLNDAQSQIDAQRSQLDGLRSQLNDRRAQFEANKDNMSEEQVAATEAALNEAQVQIDAGDAQLNAAQSELDSKRAQVQSQLQNAQSQLDSASAAIAKGESDLAQGKSDYQSGLAEYESARSEADSKFADAEAELADAQGDINAIEHPEWLVMDRSKNYGAESYAQDASRINSIAQVFPLIFFLVAALVALTTMTRMVEEERMIIGTYKALGYSRARISMKYLLYALVASLGGSVVGIAALSITLPAIIMIAYSVMYIVPIANLGIDWWVAGISCLVGVGITLVATWAAVASTLRESPADLMLPKAPKSGKRILLERIRPLWRHLSFLWKVTCRNLFRYKKRMIMTVIGIAGCTALLLTGFGLQNSINDIIDIQYGEIIKYNTTVIMDDDATDEDKEALNRLLSQEGEVENEASAIRESVVALGGINEYAVPLIVPTNPDEYESVRVMRERVGHKPLELTDGGALISEKLGALTNVGVGDYIEVAVPDLMGNATDERVRLKVDGLLENYVENSIYLTPAYYEEVFGKSAQSDLGELGYNAIYIDSTLDKAGRERLSKDASNIDGVKTLAYNDETIDAYRSSLNSVNMVVYVLIGAAALLAFIVLYNLTNINITERMREIATLKVLGFTRKEINHYIFREIMILSIVGALAGLVLGVFLEGFVVVTAEVDAAMFGRTIHAWSYLASFALTILFTIIVMLFMRGKLDHVDMIESLKSNE